MKKPRKKKQRRGKRPQIVMRRMAEEQAECHRLRLMGDRASLAKADKIESEWKNHPDYDPAKYKKPVGLYALLSVAQRLAALTGTV